MDLSPFSLAGRRALVTGGGRGIGRACALALAQAGAEVWVVSRTRAQLDETVKSIRHQGGKASALQADLGSSDEVENLALRICRASPPEILVNNAAISPIYKGAEAVAPEEWNRILRLNLDATFHLTQRLGGRMLERGGGAIVNLTSIGAERALPHLCAYTASKAALGQLTRTLAVEWASSGVRVNAVAPAYVETAMTAGIQENASLRRRVEERTPMGRFARPHEIAWAVVFLASDAASYITGHTLFVDGGWTSL